MEIGERIDSEMKRQGMSQSELARRVGVTQSSISQLIKGSVSGSRYLHVIARELGVTTDWLTGETDDPLQKIISENRLSYRAMELDAGLAASQMGLAAVRHIDLSYGMGATFLDVPVEEETRHFPREFLRQYTRSAPEHLFWASGIGDSMMPDIADSDTMLIDTSQKSVTMGDRIWAVALGQVGMVKRLRPLPDGSVEMISSNPSVPVARAVDGEMDVIGRVVAVVRKI